jgi:O-antigen ligase
MGGRDVIWTIGWEMIKNHPIAGVGFGNFTSIYGQYSLPLRGWYAESDPHNVFVAFQAELGVVGTALFILFLSRIYKNIRSFDAGQVKEKAWAVAMLLYVVVGAMTNSLHYGKFFWFALALLVAFTSQVEPHPSVPALSEGRGRYLTAGGCLHE